MGIKRTAALGSLFLFLLGVACSGSDEAGTTDASGGADAEAISREGELGTGTTGGGGARGLAYDADIESLGEPLPAGKGNQSAGRSLTGTPDVGPSVIKTATVDIEVEEDSFRDAVRDGIATAERYGGFVVTTAVEDEDRGRGSIIIRVPSVRFGDALSDLEDLGDVTSETVSGQDVGQEFVDLQARLRNYTAQEVVLLRLMDRAATVVDTIRVQGELQGVQLEIERLRGRIRYLDDQTSLGTIEVRIAEIGAAPQASGELGKAWERAKDGFIAVVAGLIASLGVVVPIALLIGLVVLVVRLRPRLTP